MQENRDLEEQCRKILENSGGLVADRARAILLEDSMLKDLQAPLEFISKTWRDPLTPALMSLSCEAVGGQSEETHDSALALTLVNLAFYVWDDVIDKAPCKSLKPTLFGKFGEAQALIVGGIASAKAFSILNAMNMEREKRQTVNGLFWSLCARMAQAEFVTLKLRGEKEMSSSKSFWKIETEADADLGTCMRVGAVIGNASSKEIGHIAKYGQCFGVILELWKDFMVSTNLTLELADKIENGNLPYSLLWAMEQSEKLRKKIISPNKKQAKQRRIKEIMECVMETKLLDHISHTICSLANEAETEISALKTNSALEELRFLVRIQPEIFCRSLPMYNG